ncbi:protein rhomboid [Manduca sexta]|uniref:Peptidase S54 rhomboid domain-containing protein n=1 Tax=Manduca sexta TaxID=7130 RepID=A0A921ZH25_MANSE|nr:protein rhomboid [Manduca sexta]KAG6457256.1 hypothetical protein O3G_MSEX010205 [Manduca sexta]
MAPDAEDCEAALNPKAPSVPVHGSRILPQSPPAAYGWTENEAEPSSPGENRRLLPTVETKTKPRLQDGLTLGVHGHKKHTKCPQIQKNVKKKKSNFQKRKEKLVALLKPPRFITSMIFVMISIHFLASAEFRRLLEWSPGSWWSEPWRLLTYGFVHANNGHLALNALVALAVGWRLESEQGWWRVVCVWGGGVAAGALGAGALQPSVRVVGASAAVYALLTAHLPNVCLRFGHIPLWWFRPLSVLVLGASEGCWALLRSSESFNNSLPRSHVRSYDHVAWSAHSLGAAVGIPLAFLVFTGENDGKRHIVCCRVASVILLASGTVLALVYYTYLYNIMKY